MKVLFVLLVVIQCAHFGNSLECHVLGNEKCMPRDSLVETNPHGDIKYYQFLLKTKKCLGSCDTLNEPMLRQC